MLCTYDSGLSVCGLVPALSELDVAERLVSSVPFLSVAAASVRLALVFADPVSLAVSLGSWFLPSPLAV